MKNNYKKGGYGFGHAKKELIELIINNYSEQRKKFNYYISNPNEVENLYKNIEEKFGRVDLLFNNAGVGIPAKTMDEISFDEWKYVVDINLNGMFLCSKYAFDLMKRQDP